MSRLKKYCSDRIIILADDDYNVATLVCQKLRDHPDSHLHEETHGKSFAVVWENKNI